MLALRLVKTNMGIHLIIRPHQFVRKVSESIMAVDLLENIYRK